MEITSALPEIYTNLLIQNPGIPGLFLAEHSQETQIRVIQAYIAKMSHPV